MKQKTYSYDVADQTKFKTTMLKSSLCYYSDAYILVRGTIRITRHRNDYTAKWADERNNGAIFKTWAPFRDCII